MLNKNYFLNALLFANAKAVIQKSEKTQDDFLSYNIVKKSTKSK
jgi:hypothetical protein